MVGDTDYDVVAKAINSDIVIIAQGHQSWSRLQGLHPMCLINIPPTS